MLTEAEKKWLRERRHENCETCKTHRLLCDRCSHIHRGNVWAWNRFTLSGLNVETTYNELQDAAEFEARVARRLARIRLLPCAGRGGECIEPPIHSITCEDCTLKYARLVIEKEMEAENA